MSRAERVARAVYDVRFLLVVVVVTVLLAILIPIRQNRTTNDRLLQTATATRQTQVDNTDTNRQIKDCLDPSGKCYKLAVAAQAARAKQAQETLIITNACSIFVREGGDDSRSMEEIEKAIRQCVESRQAANAKNRKEQD